MQQQKWQQKANGIKESGDECACFADCGLIVPCCFWVIHPSKVLLRI